ncbi:MAG: type II secretion system protein [Betaproteobacteria bacterium]|nr:type II secretion system protein [Betaproteobacteria bacterium]
MNVPTLTLTLSRPGGRGRVPSPRLRGEEQGEGRVRWHRLRGQPAARSGGFTYLGVLMLFAVMSFALTVAIGVWQTAQKRDKEEELLFVGDQIRRAIGMYAANAARYPRNLEELLKDSGFPEVRRYLRKVYRDPMTGRAEWGLVKSAGDTIIGVYSLSEGEPFKKSGFSLADQDFDGKKKYSEWVFLAKAAQGSAGATAPASASGFPGSLAPASPGATQSSTTPQQPGLSGARRRR